MNYFWSQPKASERHSQRFKSKYSLAHRIQNRERLELKYPKGQFIYAVLQGLDNLANRNKGYMIIGIQSKMTVMYLIEYLRKILQLKDKQGIFIKVRNRIVDVSQTLGSLYEKESEEDGFVYIEVKTESTF